MKNKHIYIDESGNSINNIIICFIVFSKIEYVEKIDHIVNKFKSKFNRINTELHFNKESLSLKKKFFENITELNGGIISI